MNDFEQPRLRAAALAMRPCVRLGGPEGNARLTGMTAAVLLVLLAIEGVTVLFLRPLLSVHIFVGMLLIPPVVLKLASTGWRFARYYAGVGPYKAKGPPQLLMRMLVYAARIPRLLAADFRPRERTDGSLLRRGALAAALVAGATLGAATFPLAGPWLHAR